jgi:hypothetical protein
MIRFISWYGLFFNIFLLILAMITLGSYLIYERNFENADFIILSVALMIILFTISSSLYLIKGINRNRDTRRQRLDLLDEVSLFDQLPESPPAKFDFLLIWNWIYAVMLIGLSVYLFLLMLKNPAGDVHPIVPTIVSLILFNGLGMAYYNWKQLP